MDNEALEAQKLQAEIDKIRLDIQDRPKQWHEIFKIAGTVIAAAATIGTLALGTFTHLYQRTQDLKFRISKEMIDLIKQMDPKENPSQRRAAALGLGLLGEPAVPILVENLDVPHAEEVHRAIYKSLALVAVKEKNALAVLNPLKHAFDGIVKRELNKEEPAQNLILAHKNALEAIANISNEAIHPGLMVQVRGEIKKLFEDVRNNIQSYGAKPPEKWNGVVSELDTSIKRLSQ